jgi:hypothetical protein
MIVILTFNSCKKSSSPAPEKQLTNVITFTANGKNYSISNLTVDAQQGIFSLSGNQNNDFGAFIGVGGDQKGNYSFDDGTATIQISLSSSQIDIYNSNTGQLTITSATATHVSGTFSGMFKSVIISTPAVPLLSITGTFDADLPH